MHAPQAYIFSVSQIRPRINCPLQVLFTFCFPLHSCSPASGQYVLNIFALAVPLTPHNIRYQRQECNIDHAGCAYVLLCMRYTHGPTHPRTPVKNLWHTPFLESSRSPCTSHQIMPLQYETGKGIARKDTFCTLVLVWYGVR
jgi:hypothetical protein